MSPSSLTFTDEDWKQTQTVTVTGNKNDEIVNPGRSGTLTHTASDSYSTPVPLTVNINDNDLAEIEVTPSRLTVNEGSTAITITYSVELTSYPASNLTLTPTVPSDSGVTVLVARIDTGR